MKERLRQGFLICRVLNLLYLCSCYPYLAVRAKGGAVVGVAAVVVAVVDVLHSAVWHAMAMS